MLSELKIFRLKRNIGFLF